MDNIIKKSKKSSGIMKDVVFASISVYALLFTIIAIFIIKQVLIMPSLCHQPLQQYTGN